MRPEAAATTAPNTHALWFAGLVAAVSVPFAFWAVIIVIEVAQGRSPFGEEVMRSLGLLVFFGLPMSLIVMFVIGYPLALMLRHFGRLVALNVCAGGVAIGTLFALVGSVFLPAGQASFALVLLAAGAGLFAGIVFCLAAGIPFRRPTP